MTLARTPHGERAAPTKAAGGVTCHPCSLRGRLMSRVLVPLMFRVRLPGPMRLRRDRARGPALPPRRIRQAFAVSEELAQGTRLFRLRDRDRPQPARVLYLHGGGYMFDLIPAQWAIIAGLCHHGGAEVLTPIYPLAPEATVDEGLAAVASAWDSAVAEVGAQRVILAGDSAGGGMALAWAQHLRDAGRPLPAGLVLLSPWLDATVSGPDQPSLARLDAMLSSDRLRMAGKLWSGAHGPDHPLVSPLFGDLSALPPMQVFAGTRDLLFSDALRLAERLPSIDLRLYDQMFHVWLPAPIPEARHALETAGRFVRDRTRTG